MSSRHEIQLHAVNAVCGHYKIAATAWQKARNAGRIGATELGHLMGGAPMPQPGVLHDKQIRDHLSAFVSPLNEAQLERRQQYDAKVLPHLFEYYGVQPAHGKGATTLSRPRRGPRLPGPATVRMDAPEGVGRGRATLQHELAEKVIRDNLAVGQHPYPLADFASHAGIDPLLAERMGQVDPAVHVAFDGMRRTPEGLPFMGENERAMRILKQRGMTANYVPPLGGRAHRSAADAVSRMPLGRRYTRRAASPDALHANVDPAYREWSGGPVTVPPAAEARFVANNAQPTRHTQDQVREFIGARSAGPLSDQAYGEARRALMAREAQAAQAVQAARPAAARPAAAQDQARVDLPPQIRASRTNLTPGAPLAAAAALSAAALYGVYPDARDN